MTAEDRYATPAAFRRALTQRLRQASMEGAWTLQQLQRQVAYDRLLERLYLVDDGWIVKGATALLARDLGVRGSLDVDVYREVARDVAEADLRAAADRDLGDWFRFEIGAAAITGDRAARLPVKAVIGATAWVGFHVDLVGSDLEDDRAPRGRAARCEGDHPSCGPEGLQGVSAGRSCGRQGGRDIRAPRRGASAVDSVQGRHRPRLHRYRSVGLGGGTALGVGVGVPTARAHVAVVVRCA